MTEPIKNAVVEDDPEYLLLHPDGRVTRDARVSVSKEEFLQMAQGYMCARCFEPLRESYPEICPLPGCGFQIKKLQDKYLEEHFRGEDWLGPSKATLNELDNQLDKLWTPERSRNAGNTQ